jgi:hypothetical protein
MQSLVTWLKRQACLASLLVAACSGGGVYASETPCTPLNTFIESVTKSPELTFVNQHNNLVLVYETRKNVLIVSIDTTSEMVCVEIFGEKVVKVKG